MGPEWLTGPILGNFGSCFMGMWLCFCIFFVQNIMPLDKIVLTSGRIFDYRL